MKKKVDDPKQEDRETQAEELEEKIALSLINPKKTPAPPPYTPGTLYGLIKRANLYRGAGEA